MQCHHHAYQSIFVAKARFSVGSAERRRHTGKEPRPSSFMGSVITRARAECNCVPGACDSGSYAPFTSLLHDEAPWPLSISSQVSCSSREHRLRTTRVKYKRAWSTCICDDDVKVA